MSKFTLEKSCVDTINEKVLYSLGAKKKLVGKTIFKLSPQWENFLRLLAKTFHLTIREFLDSLATIAQQAHSKGELLLSSEQTEGKRMSYTISNEAKKTFTKLAQEYSTTRDNIVQSTLSYIANEFKKNSLSIQEKIMYGNILNDALHKMHNIYFSEEVSNARKKLCAAGDPSFSEVDEKLVYIEQLSEIGLYLDNYIKEKQKELV